MSWKDYVDRHASGMTQVEVAERVGVSQAAISRWRSGQQGVDAGMAIQFARAVGDKPLTALVAAEFLTPEEARQRPAAAPSLDSLSDDQLVEEIRLRMKRGGELGGHTAATKDPGSGPGNNVRLVTPPDDDLDDLDPESEEAPPVVGARPLPRAARKPRKGSGGEQGSDR